MAGVSAAPAARAGAGGELGPALTLLFAFACFFPFPAVAIGATTGLQISHALALLLAAWIVPRRPPGRHLLVLTLLVGCLLASAYGSLLLGTIVVADVMVKSMVAAVLALVVLLPAGSVATRANLGALAVAAALAILVHAAVGAYQAYGFARSTFPLLGLYQNPSFLPLAEVADDYALYIRRPFGLFPEPSAMTASLGPWLLLLAGLLLRRQSRAALAPWSRVVVAAAVAGGTALLLGARSGYAPLWMAATLPVLGYYAVAPGRARSRRLILVLAAAPALLFAALAVVDTRLSQEAVRQNDSWQARSQSIVIGLTAPSRDLAHFLVGFGPGQSATFLQGASSAELLPPWYASPTAEPVIAVWSVLGGLYMETGLLGALAIGALLAVVARAVARSAARLLGACALVAWLAGVTVTTSYVALSPIWLFLGVLLAWDRVFAPELVVAAQPISARRPVRPGPAPRLAPGAIG